MAQVFHVRSWRNKMGWSRKEAADQLGLSVHTIKSYELHRRDLSKPIQQLMERLEEEKNALGLGTNPCEQDTFAPVFIAGGIFSKPIINDQGPLSSASLMTYRPGSLATSHELHSICNASGTQASLLASPLLTPQSFTLQTVDELREHLLSLKSQSPKVVLFPCTVPQSIFAFEVVKDILFDYTTKPIVISFYSFEEHRQSDVFGNIEEWVSSLPPFGQYLFVEKRCQSSLEMVYCVVNHKGKSVLSWENDKELVMAQLLALTCPSHDTQPTSEAHTQDTSFEETITRTTQAKQLVSSQQDKAYQTSESTTHRQNVKADHLLD